MPQPTSDQIRARAHELWELAGRPEGREQEFWYEAECELKANASPPAGAGTINPDEKSSTFTE
jgi:Protein of unknown function (DUF2934)